MAQKKPTQSRTRLYFLSIVFVCSAILLLFILQQQFSIFTPKPRPSMRQYIVNQEPPSVGPTRIPTPTISTQTFTSSDLGISFKYLSSYPNLFTPKEVGDTVYLDFNFAHGNLADDNLYVKVLAKNPDDTLEAAVRKQFLQGYSDQKCLFRDNSAKTSGQPSSYIRLSVYPADSNQERDNVNKTDCPADLIGQSQPSYFLMDPAHPGKFLLVHIGGGNAPSGVYGAGTWDETIRISQ